MARRATEARERTLDDAVREQEWAAKRQARLEQRAAAAGRAEAVRAKGASKQTYRWGGGGRS